MAQNFGKCTSCHSSIQYSVYYFHCALFKPEWTFWRIFTCYVYLKVKYTVV